MDLNIDAVLRDRLEARRGDWPRIASKAGLSHSWLSQFVRRKIPNPGLLTLRQLAAALDAVPQGSADQGSAPTGPGDLDERAPAPKLDPSAGTGTNEQEPQTHAA